MEVDTEDNTGEKKKKSDDDNLEKKDNLLQNPSRVTPNQVSYIQWIDKRYKPLTFRLSGFVMVGIQNQPENRICLTKRNICRSCIY